METNGAFEIKGNEKITIDYSLSSNKDGLKLKAKKLQLQLEGFEFADKSANHILAKSPNFKIETDVEINSGKDKLTAAIGKAKNRKQRLPVFNA